MTRTCNTRIRRILPIVCVGALCRIVAAQPDTLERQEVDAITVNKQDIEHRIDITGEVVAARSIEIKVPRMRHSFGSTVTFLAEEGAHIQRGKRILELDTSSLESQRSEAERKLDEAMLKIEKTKADLAAQRSDLLNEIAQAEADLDVAQLYARIDKELIAANDFQRYQVESEKAQLALEKARERLTNHQEGYQAEMALVAIEKSQAEIELKKIESDIELMHVDAPQDGIVIYGDNWASNRKVQVGDTLYRGMTVLTLPDLSSMQVSGFVYDTEFRHVSRGMACLITLDAIPGMRWKGILESLTSIASRKGFATEHKVFRANVKPDSFDPQLIKPGMSARIEIPIVLASRVRAVPRPYVGTGLATSYYVIKGTDRDRLSTQTVQIGSFGDHYVEIRSGLEVGDRIWPLGVREDRP